MIVVRFNAQRPRRRHVVVDEMKHALEQLALQSHYPGRALAPEWPEREPAEWPCVDDSET
jgi:hypothetical protein